MSYKIRTYGDPVLKSQGGAVDNVDGKVIRLVDEMFDTLIDSGNGLGARGPADRRAEAGGGVGSGR